MRKSRSHEMFSRVEIVAGETADWCRLHRDTFLSMATIRPTAQRMGDQQLEILSTAKKRKFYSKQLKKLIIA